MSNKLPYGWTVPTVQEIQETADAAGNLKKVLECILYNAKRRDIPPTDLLRTIMEWAEAGLLLEAEPIVISISGADYSAHSKHGSSQTAVLIDYEGTQNYDDDAVTLVPQQDGDLSRAVVYAMGIGKLDPAIAEFARMFAAGEDIPEDYDV